MSKKIKYLNGTISLRKYIVCNAAENRKYSLKLGSNLTILKNFKEKFKYLIMYRVKKGAIDPIDSLNKAYKYFACKVRKELEKSLLKVNVVFLTNFIKPQSGETEIDNFQTMNRVIDRNTDSKLFYEVHIKNKILTIMEEFQERGWSLSKILQ